jgi:tetratricopeptide (TPR) repeat protein
VDDKDGVARALNDLGDVSRQEGNLDAAEMSYQAAKATAQEIDDRSAAAYVLAGLGDVLMDRGNLAGARTFHEQSLAIRNQTGEKQAAAESRTALAALSIQEGNPGGAEAVLRDCIAQFHQAHQSDDELIAISDLIDAQLAQGKQSDASTNVAQAGAGAAKSQNVRIRLEFALQSARVSLASRSPESARIPLQHVQQQAIRHRFLSLAYEARLALADLEQRTGKVAAAKAQLASLHESARVNGFGLIARKVASEASAARLTR